VNSFQRGLWTQVIRGGAWSDNNISLVFTFQDTVEPDMIRRACAQLLRSNWELRSRFVGAAGRQETLPTADALDYQHLYVDPATLEATIAMEERRPFKMDEGPLCRFRCYEASLNRPVLQVTVHHLVLDGESCGLLARQLVNALAAPQEDQPEAAPPAGHEATWTHRPVAWTAEQWAAVSKLPSSPLALTGSTGRSTRAGISRETDTFSLLLNPADLFASEQLASTLNVSPAVPWFAALCLLLREREQSIPVVAVAASARRPENAGHVGNFVNEVPVASTCDDAVPVADVVRRMAADVREALALRHVPLSDINRVVKPWRARGVDSLAQVIFTFLNVPAKLSSADGSVRCQMHLVPRRGASVPLGIGVYVRSPSNAELFVEYSCDLFDASGIREFTESYVQLLRRVAGSLRSPLREVQGRVVSIPPSLSVARGPTVEINPKCVHDLIAEVASQEPNATAIIEGNTAVTYQELNADAIRLANHLTRLGVEPEDCVAVCLPRSANYVKAALSVLKASGAYVPVDPEYPPSRIEHIINDSRARVALVVSSTAHRIPATVQIIDVETALSTWTASSERREHACTPDSLAYVIYTSGSTGMPKGVMVEHRALNNLVAWHNRT